jgi:hypothetical protein
MDFSVSLESYSTSKLTHHIPGFRLNTMPMLTSEEGFTSALSTEMKAESADDSPAKHIPAEIPANSTKKAATIL